MNKTIFALAAGVAFAQPAVAQDGGDSTARDGVRIEARAIWETPTVSSVIEDDDVYKLGSAFAFGAEAGFDLAVSETIVVGPYANYEFSTVENCDGTDCVSAKSNVSAGLHVGLAVGESGQVYGKAGYSSLTLETNLLGGNLQESGAGAGFAVGYEHGFGENLYGRLEFGYADNGQIFGINFQRRHAGVALGARF